MKIGFANVKNQDVANVKKWKSYPIIKSDLIIVIPAVISNACKISFVITTEPATPATTRKIFSML